MTVHCCPLPLLLPFVHCFIVNTNVGLIFFSFLVVEHWRKIYDLMTFNAWLCASDKREENGFCALTIRHQTRQFICECIKFHFVGAATNQNEMLILCGTVGFSMCENFPLNIQSSHPNDFLSIDFSKVFCIE